VAPQGYKKPKLQIKLILFFFQENVGITVAIPNSDLQKAAFDEGYVNWVIGVLKQYRRIINFVAIGKPLSDLSFCHSQGCLEIWGFFRLANVINLDPTFTSDFF
jgi:hypothetical protein